MQLKLSKIWSKSICLVVLNSRGIILVDDLKNEKYTKNSKEYSQNDLQLSFDFAKQYTSIKIVK